MSDQPSAVTQNTISLSQKRKMLILIGVITGSLAPTFYSFARANVQAAILSDLGGMQFYSIAAIMALLTMAVCTPIAGKLGDLYGRKKLFLGSSIVFFISIIGCAVAPNTQLYIVATAVSGAAQGFVTALTNAIIADIATEKERPKYVGYNSLASTVIQIIAPLTSGLITDAFGWRAVFLVGTPFPIIAVILLARCMPAIKRELAVKPKVDVVGTLAFLGTILPILVLLSLGGSTIPWASSTTYILAGVAVVCAVILGVVDTRHESPMISFYVFKNSAFLKIFLACLFFSLANSANSYIPYYLQNIMGLSASASGTLITPRSIASAIATLSIGVIISKTGKYKEPLIILLITQVLTYAMMAFGFTSNANTVFIIITGIVNGLGSIAMLVAVMSLGMMVIQPKDMGVGVSLLTFTSSLGASIGNALGGMFTNGAFGNTVIPNELLSALTPEQIGQLSSPNILRNRATVDSIRATLPANLTGTFDSMITSFREVVNKGVSNLWLTIAIMCAVALILVLSVKLPKREKQQASVK